MYELIDQLLVTSSESGEFDKHRWLIKACSVGLHKRKMKLVSQDGARRKLQFNPSSQRLYYLDISSTKLRTKVIQRILASNGKVEEFLSKDVNLVLTDRNSIAKETETCGNGDVPQKPRLPLSRGKILNNIRF